jgi:hypothetical protein
VPLRTLWLRLVGFVSCSRSFMHPSLRRQSSSVTTSVLSIFFSRTRKRHAHLFIKKEEKKDPKWISIGRPPLRWSKTKKQKYIHK